MIIKNKSFSLIWQIRTVFIFIMAAILLSTLTFAASSTTTKTKAVYSYTTAKKSKTYKNASKVKAEWSYQMPVLKGSSAAVKKINAAIKKNYSAQKSRYTTLKAHAQGDSQNGIRDGAVYSMKTKAKVTYNKNGVFSVHYTHSWFAGGIQNIWSTGETFSLKTGKRMSVTSFLKGSTSKVRKRIIAAYKKAMPYASSYALDELKKEKLSSLSFFRKGNKICICLPTDYGTTGGGADVYLKIG